MRTSGNRRSAAKRSPKIGELPSVGAQDVVEQSSRLLAEAYFAPWAFQQWNENDVGIDAIVEVRHPEAGGSVTPTGKRFNLQLKGTEGDGPPFGIDIKVKTLRYWQAQTEPVLLLVAQTNAKVLYARWIDELLARELAAQSPTWFAQATFRIKLGTEHELVPIRRAAIASHVMNFVRRPATVLQHGQYRELHDRSCALADEILALAVKLQLPSVASRLSDLRRELQEATFRLGVTGPTRAGKSTFINALFRRGDELLPTGDDRTTAVPLIVGPGTVEELIVRKMDGKSEHRPATREVLTAIADQQADPSAHETVKAVEVRLTDEALQVGLEVVDAPGLHDPSDAIRGVTAAILTTAHAFVYLIDVSSAADGGFSVTEQHTKDLKGLLAQKKHVFLVLNKADKLDTDRIDRVRTMVLRDLARFGCEQLATPDRIIFVSAKEALAWVRSSRESVSPLADFEHRLWSHLLQENEAGVHRLMRALIQLAQGVADFQSQLGFAAASAAEAVQLQRSLRAAEPLVAATITVLEERKHVLLNDTSVQIRQAAEATITAVSTWVRSTPLSQSLSANDIRNQTASTFASRLQLVTKQARGRLVGVSVFVDEKIEEVLSQVRLGGVSHPAIDSLCSVAIPAPDLSQLVAQQFFAGGLLGFVLGSILSGPAGWFSLFGALILGNFDFAKRDKREKALAEVAKSVRQDAARLVSEFDRSVGPFFVELRQRIHDRLEVFFQTANRQLANLGVAASPDRERDLKMARELITAAESEIGQVRDVLAPSVVSVTSIDTVVGQSSATTP